MHATYITDDTSALAVRADARLMARTADAIRDSSRWPREGLPPDAGRKLALLRVSLPLVAPAGRGEAEELAGLVNAMQSRYARGRVELPGVSSPLDVEALGRLLATDRDPARLEAAWHGWHDLARPMRGEFERYVELANRGAREIGFADTGAMWRSRYDAPPAEVDRELGRLWSELEPFYRELHAFVRARLVEVYGTDRVDPRGPIPAHLLGNMWGQSWEHLEELVRPAIGAAGPSLTAALRSRGTTARQMVEYAERFFVSLGFAPLPASFWERSMLVRPRDREVICHASAWDLDFVEDLRIKMCIEPTEEDFRTIHHELGHTFYQRACAPLPFLFRDGANDGFHEAIGDTIGLSVTPEYLRRVGLFAAGDAPAPDDEAGAALELLPAALDHLPFLPFGLLVDRWRWRVFDGTIAAAEYQPTWWEYRRRYQGLAPSRPRSADGFDPGAKFHIAANVPYLRYFLAGVLQFQFHRALARLAGATGPLHRVSIYGSRAAGARLQALLALGASRPWPDALAELTGERRLDAGALLEYFAPLRRWLAERCRELPVGW